MAIGRPVWSGHIRLSLVSLPVKLYTATESKAKIAFHQIHEPSGKRIRYEKVVPGLGEVDTDDIVKGYELEKDDYVILTQDEINDMKLDAKKTLELVQFVDASEIDPVYFDQPYYVVPDDDISEDAFRVVRDALRKAKKIGLGQIVMRGRSYIAAIKPCGKGMLLETLRFEDEVRKSDAYFSPISEAKTDDQLLGLAEELIARNAKPFDPGRFKDEYTVALRELIKKKSQGKATRVTGADDRDDAGTNVVSLMDALKKSLGDGKDSGGAKRPAAKAKSTGGTAKTTAKSADKPASKSPAKSKAKSSSSSDKESEGKSTSSRSRRSKAA